MNQKSKPVVAEAISKMKNAMFIQLNGCKPGLHETCTFTIPVVDLMILECEAIRLENDYERLREALEDIVSVWQDVGEPLFTSQDMFARAKEVLKEVNE